MIQQLFVMKLYNEEIETILTNFNEKKATCKMQNFIFYFHFY